jgi:hypothetical protein
LKIRLPNYGTKKCEPKELITNPNNKLDIIIHDNKKGTCTLIVVAIPRDRNMIKKEAVKV